MENCFLPNYATVEKFLRHYPSDEGPYDFNGLLHLVLAGVDNLRAHVIDQDFEGWSQVVSGEKAAFLRRLLEAGLRSRVRQEKHWE